MKIALVHESRAPRGGAERVFDELQKVFPAADRYTLDTSTFLRVFPPRVRERRYLLPLHAVAPETLDLSAYDVLISSASAFAKGIVTRPATLHIAYVHAATRYLWDLTHERVGEFPPRTLRRAMAQASCHALRLWDHAAARRADLLIANSNVTRARIQKYYGRESVVIYPPVTLPTSDVDGRTSDVGSESLVGREYFLFLGRLSPYKGARLAMHAFNKLELPLVIAGEGRERRTLERLGGKTVTFQGRVPEYQLPALYQGARAVIFPSDDDFGIVPVEAMACGTPVLALRKGGAMETITEGITGEFFEEPLEELLADCVRRFLEKEDTYNPAVIRQHAQQFSAARFREEMTAFVTSAWEQGRRAEAVFARSDTTKQSPGP